MNTQYDMDSIERIGLLKMDFLGLRNLTVMEKAVREIRRTVDPHFELSAIPFDDARTYEMLGRGETVGVFQLESEGMKRVCAELQPSGFDDIMALVALYRPGPMELIPQYIASKHGRSKPQYLHAKLEPILSETYGTPLYQDQVMRMSREIAGFSLTEVDELRKVISKKQKEKIPFYQEKFVAGAASTSGTRSRTCRAALSLHRALRGICLQQGARCGVRLDRLRDRVSEGQSSAAISGGVDDVGQRQDREARGVHRRGEEGRH